MSANYLSYIVGFGGRLIFTAAPKKKITSSLSEAS